MAKGSKRNNNKKTQQQKRKKKISNRQQPTSTKHNEKNTNHHHNTHAQSSFVSDAGKGCYIARPDSLSSSSWMLGYERFDPEEYVDVDIDEIPDVAVDPFDDDDDDGCHLGGTLMVTNCSLNEYRVCYVTVFDLISSSPSTDEEERKGDHDEETEKVYFVNKLGDMMKMGTNTTSTFTTTNGEENVEKTVRNCITFIVLCPPSTFARLCSIHTTTTTSNIKNNPHSTIFDYIEIDSDIREYIPHPKPDDQHIRSISFPFQHPSSSSSVKNHTKPLLCTQGENGSLTHFMRGTLHAIDFRCEIGTLIVAVGDGMVVKVKDDESITGIAVGNMFCWNSIMIKLDERDDADDGIDNKNSSTDPLFVEYVHIKRKSSRVKVGDRVQNGQILCESGNVGFCPEPHLHFAAYRSMDDKAPTVRVKFRPEVDDDNNSFFFPKAGECYDTNGPCVDCTSGATKET